MDDEIRNSEIENDFDENMVGKVPKVPLLNLKSPNLKVEESRIN